MRPDPAHPLGFEAVGHAVAPLTPECIESAFPPASEAFSAGGEVFPADGESRPVGGEPLGAGAIVTVADLRAARSAVTDAGSFQQMRIEHYLTDVDVFDAYDAVALIRSTNCTDYVQIG